MFRENNQMKKLFYIVLLRCFFILISVLYLMIAYKLTEGYYFEIIIFLTAFVFGEKCGKWIMEFDWDK